MRTLLLITGGVLALLAGATCIAAGVYLLSFKSAAAVDAGTFDANAFDVLEHGIGVYAIGKGVAIWAGAAFMLARRPSPTKQPA